MCNNMISNKAYNEWKGLRVTSVPSDEEGHGKDRNICRSEVSDVSLSPTSKPMTFSETASTNQIEDSSTSPSTSVGIHTKQQRYQTAFNSKFASMSQVPKMSRETTPETMYECSTDDQTFVDKKVNTTDTSEYAVVNLKRDKESSYSPSPMRYEYPRIESVHPPELAPSSICVADQMKMPCPDSYAHDDCCEGAAFDNSLSLANGNAGDKRKYSRTKSIYIPSSATSATSEMVYSSQGNDSMDIGSHQDKKRRVSYQTDETVPTALYDKPQGSEFKSNPLLTTSQDSHYIQAKENLKDFLINLSKCERSNRDLLVDNLISGIKNAFHSTTAFMQSSDERGAIQRAVQAKEEGSKQQRETRLQSNPSRMMIRLDSKTSANDVTQRCVISAPPATAPTTVTVSTSIPFNMPSAERRESITKVSLQSGVSLDGEPAIEPDTAPVSNGDAFVSTESMRDGGDVAPKKDLVIDTNAPTNLDVISGRGNGPKNHQGNIAFRNLVQQYKIDYINAYTSREKRVIVIAIINAIRKKGGRFLKKVYENKKVKWEWMDESAIMIKVAQALRENAPDLKRRQGGSSPHYQIDAVSALMSLGS